MPNRDAFPVSTTLAEAARNLAQQQRKILLHQNTAAADGVSVPAAPSLHKAVTRFNHPLDASYEADNSMLVLNPMEVDFYDGNPRFDLGDDYAQLKTSIRTQGLNTKLSVTRRPGATRYMVEAGGNRRLRILKELIADGEERFHSELFVFRAWKSESTVLLRHLSENLQRAHMTLFEEASGILRLKRILEEERAETYSLRRLEELLADIGFPVTKSALSIYSFVVERLTILGPATKALTVKATRDVLQNGFNRLDRLASLFGIDTAALYEDCLNPVLEAAGRHYGETSALDHDALYENCERALAERLNSTHGELRQWLAVLKANPKAARDTLTTPAQPDASPKPVTEERVANTPVGTPALAPRAEHESLQPSNASTRCQVIAPQIAEGVAPALTEDSSDERVPAQSDVETALRTFAAAVGADAFLRVDNALPHGFYVEVPIASGSDPALPLDLRLAQPTTSPYLYHGWWLLMQMSGLVATGDDPELNDEVLAKLPPSSAWRQAADAGYEDVERIFCDVTGPKPDFAFILDWLTTPTHPVAGALNTLLASLREQRGTP